MAQAGAPQNWSFRAPSHKALKGRRGAKRNIARCYHHGRPDQEERAIERTVRQAGKRLIREALRG